LHKFRNIRFSNASLSRFICYETLSYGQWSSPTKNTKIPRRGGKRSPTGGEGAKAPLCPPCSAAPADISMWRLSRPTRRCVLLDGHTTSLAIGVSQQLDHACGTHYILNYDNVTVSESSNGCWRHTCSGTTALCDIFVKSAA